MSDISVNLNGYRVNLRVGAVVLAPSDYVLLCRMKDQDWWFLPGGRIKTNESSLMALERELCEEVGGPFRVVRPIVCAENFFKLDGVCFHELCTFYEVEWLGTKVLEQQDNASEVFEWVSRKDMLDFDVKPAFIKEYIVNPAQNLKLVIHRDGKLVSEVTE